MQTARMPLMETRHVSKVFKQGSVETRVLEDVSLQITEGDFVALMGPSGSGKSTLLNIISGLDAPSTGDVLMNGKSIVGLSESALARWRSQHIGFIFQQYHLMPVLSAFENVALPLTLFNMSRRERRERTIAALTIVGLKHRIDYMPSQLSGGQQQRVSIARAIVTDPPILIGDEPTGNLDSRSSGDVLRLFDILNSELGKTIIMVTHDAAAAAHAKRITRIRDGMLMEKNESPGAPGDLHFAGS